jgi:hypothetical protein
MSGSPPYNVVFTDLLISTGKVVLHHQTKRIFFKLLKHTNMTTLTATAKAKSIRKDKVIYWIFTSLFVLLDSVPAIWFNSPMAKEGIRSMGFPAYFGAELGIGKIIGGILLILPMIPARFKEWAYVGFGISLISAMIANIVVNGPAMGILPLVGLAILTVSYIYFHKTRETGF